MNDKDFMVSDEIADQIDESQFSFSSDIDTAPLEESVDVLGVMVIKLESKDTIIPGLLQDYKINTVSMQNKLTLQFLTDPKNVVDIHKKLSEMESVSLTIGGETVAKHRIAEMEVDTVRIQQSVDNAGCVITVVYK